MTSPADRKLTPTQRAWIELLAEQDSTRRITRRRTGATSVTKQLCITSGLVESGTRLMVDLAGEVVYLGRPTYQLTAAGRALMGLPPVAAADEEREALLVQVWSDGRDCATRIEQRLRTFTPAFQPHQFYGHHQNGAAWSEELVALALEGERLTMMEERLHRTAVTVPAFQTAWGEATAAAALAHAQKIADREARAAREVVEKTHDSQWSETAEQFLCTRCGAPWGQQGDAPCPGAAIEARD